MKRKAISDAAEDEYIQTLIDTDQFSTENVDLMSEVIDNS